MIKNLYLYKYKQMYVDILYAKVERGLKERDWCEIKKKASLLISFFHSPPFFLNNLKVIHYFIL